MLMNQHPLEKTGEIIEIAGAVNFIRVCLCEVQKDLKWTTVEKAENVGEELAATGQERPKFYGLFSPLKRNVKLILSVANAFCGASAEQKFPLHFSKSGLDRLINLCLPSAAEGWHFMASEGEEENITSCMKR